MTASALLLSAGRSRRFGGAKALAKIGTETFVERALRTLREGGCSSVTIVVAAPHEAAIRESLQDVCRSGRATFVTNPNPARGMLSSLQCGLQAAQAGPVVVALIDHPRVRAETVSRLLARVTPDYWVRPTHRGRRGHPIVLNQSAIGRVLAASPVRRTCDVLATLPAIDVEVDDPHVLDDFDRPDELVASKRIRGTTPQW